MSLQQLAKAIKERFKEAGRDVRVSIGQTPDPNFARYYVAARDANLCSLDQWATVLVEKISNYSSYSVERCALFHDGASFFAQAYPAPPDLDEMDREWDATVSKAQLLDFLNKWHHRLVREVKRLRAFDPHRIMEQYITARGFYLRDDRSIREGDPHFEGVEEAYSLCSRDPFEREAVYGGTREWAVEQAYKQLTETP